MADISLKDYSIKNILMYAGERRFAVPKLQREFVWDIKKACKLLDSIYNKIPIGTILIWDAARNNSNLLQHSHIALPSYDNYKKRVWFILDGQQRLSVLYRLQQGEEIKNSRGTRVEFDKVHFLLENSKEQLFAKISKANPKYHVRISDLLSPSWKRRLNRFKVQPRKYAKIAECRKTILEYRMPFIIMDSTNIEEAREAFLRINALGTPLSTADRLFSKASSLDLRDLARTTKQAWSHGFQHMPEIILLQSLCFSRGKIEVGKKAIEGVIERISRQVSSGKKTKKSLLKEWTKLENSMGLSIDYIKKNFNVADYGFLPSTNMIPTLSMYFFHHNNRQPSLGQKKEIKRWFWATGAATRYSGAGYRSNIIDDVNFFIKLAKRGKAKFSYKERVPKSKLLIEKYSDRSGLSKAFYCLLIGAKPRYLENNSEIPIDAVCSAYNKKQKHHVFPKSLLKNKGFKVKDYNRLCNICFIVAPENNAIGDSKPNEYLKEYLNGRSLPSFLRSHLLPTTTKSELWTNDVRRSYKKFLRERLEIICKAFESNAQMRIFSEE
jgi:hypothetical protein